ncbi:hypothetical protein EPUS_09022 [Endocarpon pusillum Z07020]|uniref:Heterokaryon incompatibility domain-containing protein n=1 Tax=Endocarpon pusillum (strain Z07020 / HMAS-L-300199) TaxID=1263415 RepID=U1GAC1_ENDPU|nr:uncharacterized protein EPUS_09022 [Endocarpon pusillum Z07020]ERF68968.1 hypothetical protein EPUS_09022 [Endocarpon pusillum Z07020]
MSLCQACHSLFSRRHIKVGKVYHVRPSAPKFSRGLETPTGNHVCSFCAYLRNLFSTPVDPQYETQATRSEGVDRSYTVSFDDRQYPLFTLNGRKEVRFKGGATVFTHQEALFNDLFFTPKSQLNTVGIDLDSQNTDSVQSLIVAEKWIRHCLSTHKTCNRWSETVEGSHLWLPTRLLDVSRQDKEFEDKIRLISRSSLQESKGYVTLSYCWGEDNSFTKLVSAKLSAFQSGIELTQLPQTFRDAVQVTRRLNYRYLWIDALCIIQDSPQDWLQEALSMAKVFAFSGLNLAAAASESADGGLFHDREHGRMNGCNISIGWENIGDLAVEKGIYHIFRLDTFRRFLGHSKLEQRGWTFQERLLSPRNLHFGEDQIYWECFESSRSEVFPDMEVTAGHFGSLSLKQRFERVSRDGEALRVWDEITRIYSRRRLTFSSDKLVALAGIAARMTGKFKPEDYLAGLWRPSLPKSLLWYTPKGGVLARQYRAPRSTVAEVLASTVSTNDGPFGPVTDGSLLMKGFVCGAASISPKLSRLCTRGVSCTRGVLCTREGEDCLCKWLASRLELFPDADSGPSDVVSIHDNLFLFPVVEKGLRRYGQMQGYWTRCGLVLEPIQNVKGRFRRIGFFEFIGVHRWLFWKHFRRRVRERDYRILPHLMAEASKSWVRDRLFHTTLRRAFTTPTLDESNYQDFDGVSKYTIEIV